MYKRTHESFVYYMNNVMRKKIFLCLFFSTCLFAFVHGQTDSENNLKFDEEKDTVIHLEEHVVVGRHIRKTSLLKLPVALSEMRREIGRASCRERV